MQEVYCEINQRNQEKYDTVSKMKRFLPLLILCLSACTPSYTSNSNLTSKIVTTGFFMPNLSGDLIFETMTELRFAIRKTGLPMLDIRYPDAKGATHKIEGDLVALRENGLRPNKLEKAEIRIIDLRTGKVVAIYRMEPQNPFQVRTPAQFSADIAGFIAKEFELQ